MMKKIIISILVVILFGGNFISCYNYRDINKVTFATCTVFDYNDLGEVDVYADCVKGYRSSNESSEKGKRLIYKGSGKTVLEAIRSINVATSSKLNFTQCKAFVFTERLALTGISKYVDIMNKDQEFLIRPYMFVLAGSPEELLKGVEGDEEYIGIFINELVVKTAKDSKVISMNVNDYLNRRENKESVNILGVLNIKPDVNGNRLELKGGAAMKNDIMVARIGESESMNYNLLTDKIETGNLEVTNPENPDSFISLELLNSGVKSKILYEDGKIILHKKIKLTCSIDESQERLIVDNQLINHITKIAQSNISEYSTTMFNYYKKRGVDILNVADLFEKKYPNVNLDKSVIELAEVKVDVDLDIIGGSVGNNTY